jgi:Cof subfamily protein (haloacid dehalogenase superfamily)
MIRLAAFDLDGTLLNTNKEVTPAVRRAVRGAAAKGIEIVLDTGRAPSECREVLAALPEVRYAVFCTGALVLDTKTGRTIARRSLTADEGRRIYARLRPFDGLLGYFADGVIHDGADKLRNAERYAPAAVVPSLRSWHTAENDLDAFVAAWNGPVDKIHIYYRDPAERDRARAAVQDLDAFITTTDVADLELMPRGADKGEGLRLLAEALGVERRDVLAVGDNENDRQMLVWAGKSAVVGNAPPALRSLADAVGPSNDADGAAWILDRAARGEL